MAITVDILIAVAVALAVLGITGLGSTVDSLKERVAKLENEVQLLRDAQQ